MNYFRYLKKSFAPYLLSGLVLGIAVFSLITGQRYSSHLSGVLADMNNITENKDRIKKQIVEIDDLVDFFREKYDVDFSDANYDAIIFRTLDRMKSDLDKATIRVGHFDPKAGAKELVVEIEATVSSYRMIVDYVEYVEALRIPDYRIEDISISREEEGRIVLYIRGFLVMPSFEAILMRKDTPYG